MSLISVKQLTTYILLGMFGFIGYAVGQGFTNATEEAGLLYIQQEIIDAPSDLHVQAGAAVAADFDGDGWTDLFCTRLQLTDKLYRNLGPDENGVVRFADISAEAGFTEATGSNGVVAVDTDNDGDLDLYVTTIYEKEFLYYLNNGDGTFSLDDGRKGGKLTSFTDHHGFSVSAGDYNRDGWADMFTTEWQISRDATDVIQHNVLMRNFGGVREDLGGWFGNATESSGTLLTGNVENPDQPTLFGFTSTFADLDGDGWQDLLVAGDFGTSQLFWNNQDSTFTEGTEAAGFGKAQNAMGMTVGDFDGDGLQDIFISSINDHRLYRNLGNRTFAEESVERFGAENLFGWGWGTTFFDYDNDGDLDLILTTGYEDFYQTFSTTLSIAPTLLWRNDDGIFTSVGESLGINDLEPGKGLLTFDYDKDGDLDVFIVNAQKEPILYRNDLNNGNAFIRIEVGGRSFIRNGIGTKLFLTATEGGSSQMREIRAGSNYLGQNEMAAHFGLGQHTGESIHELRVVWPDGVEQIFSNLEVNSTHVLTEPLSFASWAEFAFDGSGVDANQQARSADPDGDGFINFDEYALGQNPISPDGPLSITATLVDPNRFAFQFPALAGATEARIILEACPDLTNWKEVGGDGLRETLNFSTFQKQVTRYLEGNGESVQFARLRIEALDTSE